MSPQQRGTRTSPLRCQRPSWQKIDAAKKVAIVESMRMISQRMNQRLPLRHALVALIILVSLLQTAAGAGRKPNVVVVLTDDQSFAELGATGNPVIRTPHIDRLAAQSASLANFHVMPVCAPTRAGLMTGRYSYRTGVTDTWLGRSLIDPDETTLAELFAGGGYRTGIFGKWHLGDNYPRRAMDQGFQESLVLNGGGLAQPGDPPDPVDERGAYFNATLSHNGTWGKTKGYVSDVITDAAMQFIEKQRKQPFFVYLSFNCPHSPHQVPDEYRRHYPPQVFNPTNFPAVGHPMSTENNPDALARVYGMVENIDDNVGRLLAKLEALKLADDTIVVFFSDNGAQRHNGFNGGLRSWKGTPYEGGIHQFCFIRWPAQLKAGHKVDRITSHIDLAPTLLDFCNVPKPDRMKFDGRSLAPLLRGKAVDWPDRTLVAQWHRGDVPNRYRNFAIRSQDWKLVQALGREEPWDGKMEFQLYDMVRDPFEMHDVAAKHPERVAELKAAYNRWFDDVVGGRDFSKAQRIFVGATQENPVLLTREDWRGPKASWTPEGIGYWDLNIVTPARYDIRVRFDLAKADRTLTLKCGGTSAQQPIKAGTEEYLFKNVQLPAGPARLEATLQEGTTKRGVKYVEVSKP
ncbi:MAG: atsA 6 [Verrucomicrobiales bacterium]|nr:atsA 6 [Verrucomicrobiales bacterium]